MIPDRFLHFAHQGGGLLAPENTLAAFTLGAQYEPDALELDVQVTRDGEIVVMHDPTVDRTTDGHGPVSSFTLAAPAAAITVGGLITLYGYVAMFPCVAAAFLLSLLPLILIDPARSRRAEAERQAAHAETSSANG